jgi:hypothetical protein
MARYRVYSASFTGYTYAFAVRNFKAMKKMKVFTAANNICELEKGLAGPAISSSETLRS